MIGPNADDARHLLGDYTHPVHVESLREMLRSGRNVFDIPMADETTLDAVDVGGATVLSELMDRRRGQVRFARGCDVNSPSREGFADGGRARRRQRRRRDGDGRQVGTDRRLHQW